MFVYLELSISCRVTVTYDSMCYLTFTDMICVLQCKDVIWSKYSKHFVYNWGGNQSCSKIGFCVPSRKLHCHYGDKKNKGVFCRVFHVNLQIVIACAYSDSFLLCPCVCGNRFDFFFVTSVQLCKNINFTSFKLQHFKRGW